jgi:hypothetical protein
MRIFSENDLKETRSNQKQLSGPSTQPHKDDSLLIILILLLFLFDSK